jgi:pectinacetylesterase
MRPAPLCVLALALAGSATLPTSAALPEAAAAGAAPDSLGPPSTWQRVPGGPGTSCGLGDPFSFFTHAGDPRRVLVFFGGGGACWNALTCGEHPTFSSTVDAGEPRGGGILDFTRPENPCRSYSAVLIPNCTGDVHLGDREVTYAVADSAGAPTHPLLIHHQGSADALSALGWLYRSIPRPDVILVVGASAGAIAAPYYAGILAGHYPRARVIAIGDGAGGYRGGEVSRVTSVWGTVDQLHREAAYRDLDSTTLSFAAIYIHAARSAPRARFAQINSAADSVQLQFLALEGIKDVPLRTLLGENLGDIRKAVPRFRSFVAPGERHVVIGSREFYDLRVDGVALRDWVADLVQGRSVPNVGERYLERP